MDASCSFLQGAPSALTLVGDVVGVEALEVQGVRRWDFPASQSPSSSSGSALRSQVAGAGALWFRPQVALLPPSSVLFCPLPFAGPLVPEEVMVKKGGLVPASSRARCLRCAAVRTPVIASLAALRCSLRFKATWSLTANHCPSLHAHSVMALPHK